MRTKLSPLEIVAAARRHIGHVREWTADIAADQYEADLPELDSALAELGVRLACDVDLARAQATLALVLTGHRGKVTSCRPDVNNSLAHAS